MEDLVALIDIPRLDDLNIIFDDQFVSDTPQFTQFISRAPRLKAFEKAYIFLEGFEPGPTQEGITQFVDARRFTGHTIALSRWDRRETFEEVDD